MVNPTRVKKYAMASGKVINLESFKQSSFILEDIAHHLAKIQRYNGSLPIDVTYSVAEHCINLYNYFDSQETSNMTFIYKTMSLIHDMSEAFLVDLPSYMKNYLPDYKKLEVMVQSVIDKKYFLIDVKDDSFFDPYDKGIVLDEIGTIDKPRLSIYKKYNKWSALNCNIQYNGKSSDVKEEFLTLCKRMNIHD